MTTNNNRIRFQIVYFLLISSIFISGQFFSLSIAEEVKNIEPSERMLSIVKRHEATIQKWAKSTVLIEAVKEQNKKAMSLEEIKKIDKKWVEGEAEAFVKSLQSNKAGKFLYDMIQTNTLLFVEAFVCDNQGAVVAEYPKTTDYWQGDETKFTNCFKSGKEYTNPLIFDESTQTYSVQLSIPVLDNKKTIGVLIVGLKNIK